MDDIISRILDHKNEDIRRLEAENSRLKQERDEAFQVICTAYEQNARCLNGSAENTLKSYIQKVKYQSTPVAEPQEERRWCGICGSWLDRIGTGEYHCSKCEAALRDAEER